MGNEKGCASLRDFMKMSIHLMLCQSVQSSCRLIKQQDAPSPIESPANHKILTLSSRKLHPIRINSLTHWSLQLFRQTFHLIIQSNQTQCFLCPADFLKRILLFQRDIFQHRSRNCSGLLKDRCDTILIFS